MAETLAEKSYQSIRGMLASGELEPGVRLVNRTLAADLGVSVIPVREAIHRLASEGLVEHIPGAGAFVRRPSRRDLENLYVLRDAVESCAAREAAIHISESEVGSLDNVLCEAETIRDELMAQSREHATKRQFERWLTREQRFHTLLIEASHNPLLAKVVRDNRAISEVFEAQHSQPQILTAEVARVTCRGKRDLLAALRKHDGEEARRLMSEQIQRGLCTVVAFLSANDSL